MILNKNSRFKSELVKALKDELTYYNFDITSAAKEWIDSVVDYYNHYIENLSDFVDVNEFIDAIEDCIRDEDYDFAWPSTSEAAVIISKAIKQDSAHFIYITEALNYSMSPEDCFKAEWFWEGSIRPSIINWLKDFIEENT